MVSTLPGCPPATPVPRLLAVPTKCCQHLSHTGLGGLEEVSVSSLKKSTQEEIIVFSVLCSNSFRCFRRDSKSKLKNGKLPTATPGSLWKCPLSLLSSGSNPSGLGHLSQSLHSILCSWWLFSSFQEPLGTLWQMLGMVKRPGKVIVPRSRVGRVPKLGELLPPAAAPHARTHSMHLPSPSSHLCW